MNQIIEHLKNKVIVAIDASPEDPCQELAFKVSIAHAAMSGGAGAIRTGGADLIKAISKAVAIPVIGFIKLQHPDYSIVRVTPSLDDARRIIAAGAQVVAMELTQRARADGTTDREMVEQVRTACSLPILADISTYEEAIAAEEAGADLIATTLVGYTPNSQPNRGFDFDLLERICQSVKVPVIAEGHLTTPEEVQKAMRLGAHCAVVGSMISRPHLITKRFVESVMPLLDQ